MKGLAFFKAWKIVKMLRGGESRRAAGRNDRGPNADAGERTVETEVLAFRRIDAAVHRAEEKVCTITE